MTIAITDENIEQYIKQYLDGKFNDYFVDNMDNHNSLIRAEAEAMHNLSEPEKITIALDTAIAAGILDPEKQEYYNTLFVAETLGTYSPQLLSHFVISDGDKHKKKIVRIIEDKFGRGYEITSSELKELSMEQGFEYPKWLVKNHRVKRGTYRVPILLNEYDYNTVNMGLPCGDLNKQLSGMSARVTQSFKSIKAHYSLFILQATSLMSNPFTMVNGVWQTIYAAARDAVLALWNAIAELLDPALFEKLMYTWAQAFIDAGLGAIETITNAVVGAINTAIDQATALLGVPGQIASEINATIESLKSLKAQSISFLEGQQRMHKCSTKSVTISKE